MVESGIVRADGEGSVDVFLEDPPTGDPLLGAEILPSGTRDDRKPFVCVGTAVINRQTALRKLEC